MAGTSNSIATRNPVTGGEIFKFLHVRAFLQQSLCHASMQDCGTEPLLVTSGFCGAAFPCLGKAAPLRLHPTDVTKMNAVCYTINMILYLLLKGHRPWAELTLTWSSQ